MEANTLQREAQILVVEDESEIRELISLILLRQGCRVQQCASSHEALERLQKTNYDLVILDWMLPQMSGIELLKALQNKPDRAPVLMVTAKAEPQDIVQGLEAGADDYITKPFEPNIFTARVRALLRRAKPNADGKSLDADQISVGALELNTASYEVKVEGESLHLTPSEFKILAAMAAEQGRVLTRDKLISIVQGDGISVTGRTIDTHVFGLRKKMGRHADIVETIRGIGYRVRTTE